MGKKRQKRLPTIPDDVPAEVRKAADVMIERKRSSQKASERKKQAEIQLIDAMKTHRIKRVRIDGEDKYFERGSTDKVVVKVIKQPEVTNGEAAD